MAKYTCTLHGDFDDFLRYFEEELLRSSSSASVEDGSSYRSGDFRCVSRVYERYSFLGGNRVSLTLLLAGSQNEFFFSAITAGGSQAVFFKLNTLGEESFLDQAVRIVGQYRSR